MRKTWKRLASLALAFVMLCGTMTLSPTAFASAVSPQADTVSSVVNGHRDIFSSTRTGQMPAGFETSGSWKIVSGNNIDNWGGITTLSAAGTGISRPSNESWNHFLRHESGSAFAVYEDSYTDFDFTTHMMIPNGATTGAVVFRYTDENNYYYYKLTVGSGATLGKVVDGTNTELGTYRTTVKTNAWYNLRVTMTGSKIVTKINSTPYYIDLVATTPAQGGIAGTQTFNVTDSSLASGKVGYWSEGTGNASAQYCVFAVSNTAADLTLENEVLKVTTGPYGQIKELYLKSDNNTNFVSNEETHREDVGENHFLGEIIFTYEVGGTTYKASTGASDDVRTITKQDNKITVSYTTQSKEAEGIRHFTVVETYTLENDHLQFDIEIKNTGSGDLTILDLGLPMMWNNHWQFQSPYTEYASATGYYVSYNGSWLQIESAGGGAEKEDGGQKVLFLPDNSTGAKLEYRRYYSNEQSFGMAPETFYVYSKNISKEGQGYLESTSRTLAAGETDELSFRLYVTDDYLDTEETIYKAGSLDVQVNPGLVLPDDITALVDIHTMKEVNKVELITGGKTATVTAPTSTSGDHKVYSIKFNNQGRNDVKITYDGDKESVLQFWVTDSVNEAMQAHVDFLMNTLRITEADVGNPHIYSFGEYNNVTGAVDKTNVGTNHCSNNDYEQMYDGPAFIAEKNVYYPVQSEITAMDQYLIDLVFEKQIIHDENAGDLYGRLYHGCCDTAGNVGCWGDQWGTQYYKGYVVCQRVYNPVRIYNTFYSMYKAATYYGSSFEFRWKPSEYLYWAGLLATHSERLSGTTGLMGEQTVPDIIDALNREGMTDLANQLLAAATAKGNAVAREKFPFGSEFSVDRTGEEGAYFLSKLVGSRTSQIKAINKIMAWISKTPTWYQQTTGRTNDTDWWIFQYTVSLQAAAMKDWYMTHNDADAYWSMIYPAAFSSFAHVKTSNDQESNGPIGTVWWNYWPTRPYNWSWGWPVNQTGEADIDLWGGMQLLSTDVVLNDPSFGLTAYGGTAAMEDDAIVVTPQDGLYTKLNIVGAGAKIELQSDKYSQAKLTLENDQLTSITLSLNNFLKSAHGANMTVSGLKAGAYQLSINGTRQMVINVSADSAATFTYQVAGEEAELKIEPYKGHEGNLRVALVGDDALAGKGTSDWAEKGMVSQLDKLLKAQSYETQIFIGGDSGIETFDPDMVVLMTDSADDYGALIEKYQSLSLQPIVYAVTTGNETTSEAMRTAAGEKNAVLIDAWDLINAQPDLAQDNALNNNGVSKLVGMVYTAVTNQMYTAPAVVHEPYAGIEAVDFDRQSGAHYQDVRENAQSANEPYVHVDANGHIGFEGLNLDRITTGLNVDARFDGDGTLQVYTGNPQEGGRLVGQVNVTAAQGAAWTRLNAVLGSVPAAVTRAAGGASAQAAGGISAGLLELTGTTDIYLTATVGMDLKNVTMLETNIPTYRHDFSYDDNRWDEWTEEPSTGTDTSQGVYWIDGDFLGLIKGLSVENFIFDFDYALYDGEQTGGVVFRVAGNDNWTPIGLAVLFDAANDKILVVKMDGSVVTFKPNEGTWTNPADGMDANSDLVLSFAGGKEVIAEFDYDLSSYLWDDFRHLSIRVCDNTVEIYGNDGTLVGKVTDERIAAGAGRIGVWTDGESIDFTNMYIHGLEAGAPIITADPEAVTAHETETATFTVKAKGYAEGDTLTYQWQKSANEVVWEDIPGATAASYTTPALEMGDDGTYFRAVVTSNGASVTSADALLTVLHMPVVDSVTLSPVTTTANVGGSRAFTVKVTGQYEPSTEVTWTVAGAEDPEGTYVRGDGTLFVSKEETVGATLTVTATSVYDNTKSASATVTLTEAVTQDDVVLYYVFNEGSGNTVTDYSKNGYHGTINGNTTTSWNKDGYAFDRSSHIAVGSNAKLVSSNMTLVYKVKRTGNINQNACIFWGMPHEQYNTQGFWMNISGGNPLFVNTNGGEYTLPGSELSINDFYTLNQWTEVAISVDSTTGEMAIYRNGKLVGSATGRRITAPANPQNTIGMAGWDNELLNGVTMGEFVIFNKALSEAEATAVYKGEFYPDTSGVEHETKYESISIDPKTASTRPGGTVTFTSKVFGSFLPEDGQAVTWELTGNQSQSTTLNNGVLTVGADEPAGTLTVKVTSQKAPEFSAEATVTVVPVVPATKENIILHYDFSDGSGTTVTDKSGKENDGTITGNSDDAWTEDGYAFDGASYITAGNGAQLVSSDMTLVYKMKRTDSFTGSVSLFWGCDSWDGNGMWLNIPDSPLFVSATGFNTYSVAGVINDFYPQDEWVEVAVTISLTGELAIYRNGELVGSATGKFVTPPTSAPNTIGTAGGGEMLHNATMGEYIIFDKALTADEVKAVYAGTFGSDDAEDTEHAGASGSAAYAAVRAEGSSIDLGDPQFEITRSGYKFSGWKDEQGNTYSSTDVIEVTGSMVLTAQWKKNGGGVGGGGWGVPGQPAQPSDPDPVPVVTENPDGSTTTTVTDPKTGTVTITTTWPDGHTIVRVEEANGDVSITVTNADGVELADMTVPAVIPATDNGFTDVPDGHYAENAINQAVGMGLINGIGGSLFGTNASINRAQVATILYRLAGMKDTKFENSFDDVNSGHYAESAIGWANAAGVVTGYSESTFAPDKEITRVEMAAMLYRFAKLVGLDTGCDAKVLDSFQDSNKIGGWAEEAMAWCVSNGIIRGEGNSILNPDGFTKRCDAVVMVLRFCEKFGK